MHAPPIHYLRWARSRRPPLEGELQLIASGMAPPGPDLLEFPSPAELLAFDPGDHPPLATRIAADLGLPPERALLAAGSHQMLWLLVQARLAGCPGPVIVEEPAYEPLLRIPQALGAPVYRLPRPRAQGFAPQLERLEELAAQRPSLLLLSHPHNPTGVELRDGERRQLRQWAADTGCAILSDEVYLEFLPGGPPEGLLDPSDDDADIAVVRSFTKVFGLGGLRASVALGPAPWLARAAGLSDYFSVALPAPSQALALAAWESREALWKRARDTAADGRARVAAWLGGDGAGFEATMPSSGIICFPRPGAELEAALLARARRQLTDQVGNFGYGLDEHPARAHLWLEALRREERLLLTPGAFFGDASALRLGYGVPPATLDDALSRLSRFARGALEDA